MKNTIAYKIGSLKQKGDRTKDIISYAIPELISSMVLITLPPLVDSYIVSNSQSITSFGALSMTINVLYLMTKLAEGIPIAAIAVMGRYNGAKLFGGRFLWACFNFYSSILERFASSRGLMFRNKWLPLACPFCDCARLVFF